MRVLHVGDDFAGLRPCGLTLYSDALMRGQARRGHEVSYVFSGRHYPRLSQPRLKRWRHGPIRMIELVGSPNHRHWELGTTQPDLDLAEPAGEATFTAALRESDAELVHVHELARLPSSIIDLARQAGVPIVMTLHDYAPLCPTVRLLEADGRRCERADVGADCARNCANAPSGPQHLIDWTLRYERRRLKRAIPVVRSVNLAPIGPVVGAALGALRGPSGSPASTFGSDPAPRPGPPPADAFQRRRNRNVVRLSACDRLIAPSARVAELYRILGIPADRLTVQRLTLPHLETLVPTGPPSVHDPLTFVALGAGASRAKGSQVLVEAVEALERALGPEPYRLILAGHVEPTVHDRLSATPSVRMTGPYEPEDLDALLDQADVGVMPSIWEEVHGFTGIEMLAKGLPVIGSALGGIPEYVLDGRTGWLNRSAGGAELATLMAAAVTNPSEVRRRQQVVRDRREELVTPMVGHLTQVEALYADVLAERRPDAAPRS